MVEELISFRCRSFHSADYVCQIKSSTKKIKINTTWSDRILNYHFERINAVGWWDTMSIGGVTEKKSILEI